VFVDLDRFERLSRSPHRSELQTAADLYRGEFLVDLDLDSEPFRNGSLPLKEEVRVQRVRSTERHQKSVTLRHHEAVVTHLPVEPPAVGESPEASAKPQQSKQER
jgi:hypothetical protein